MDQPNDSTSDKVYTWTIRTLYTAVIVLNVWYLLEQYRDTPEGQRIRDQVARTSKKMMTPWKYRKEYRKAVNRMMVDAWVTVDQAKKKKDQEE